MIVPETRIGNFLPNDLESFQNREDRRLGVQGVEDRFDEQDVDAALDQRAHLFAIGVSDLIERHGAKTRIVHIGREGSGDWKRA